MMKILFYLPVITEVWLETAAIPMIRALGRDAAVHVIVPPLWNGTGVSRDIFERLSQYAGGTWHLFDQPNHPLIRTAGASVPALMELVNWIAADYTICRSADIETPRIFPGRSAFLMEGDYPPFARGELVRLTDAALFAHGVMPNLTASERSLLKQPISALREALSAKAADRAESRERFFAETGLPIDRPIIGIPLEHDGSDNFYMRHSPYPENTGLVKEIAAGLDDRSVLALTVHPAQRGDLLAMERLGALQDQRILNLEAAGGGDLSPGLARHCDAMVFRDSKSIAWAGMFGTPLYRISRFATGNWFRSLPSLKGFDPDPKRVSASPERMEAALLWMGFHLANCAFKPTDPDFNLGELVDRIEQPLNPGRWLASLDRRISDIACAAASLTNLEY